MCLHKNGLRLVSMRWHARCLISYHMKIFLLSLLAAGSLVALAGCSSDNDQQTTTSTYQSATVDSKDMHPRHQQGQ